MEPMNIAHIHFAKIDSTNTWAKEHADEFDRNNLTVVIADEQTAGRGRWKRRWESPPHENIYVSFCCFVDEKRPDIGHIPQLLALAAAYVVESLGLNAKLKWPNDLLIAGKKIGGILCETVSLSPYRCVITGIGLNVNMPLEALQLIDRPATSLFAETGYIHFVESVFEALQLRFTEMLPLFLESGFDTFFPAFAERSFYHPGQPVRFHDNQKIIEGTFYCLDPNGSVILELPSGERRVFNAGEFLF